MKSYIVSHSLILIFIIALVLVLQSVWADKSIWHGYYDQPGVIKVKPINKKLEIHRPAEEYFLQKAVYRLQYTEKKNSDGILAGGVAGYHCPYYNEHKKHIRKEPHCDTIDSASSREEIVDYGVKYCCKGHYYWIRTDNHPDKYIDVKVKVQPGYHI